jgi:hypothetical protein
MQFNFKRTKFVDENGIACQCAHIKSEALEAVESAFQPGIMHTAEEIMDAYHSCETGLRICQEKHGVNLTTLKELVEKKNSEREYYREAV